MKHLFRAAQFFRPDTPRIAAVSLLAVLGVAAGLLRPWPLALVVDGVLGAKPLPAWLAAWSENKLVLLAGLAMAALALHVGQGVLSAAQNYLAIQVGLRALMRVRNEVFARLQGLSLRFHQGSPAGDVIYRATWDACAFQTWFQQGFVTLLGAGLSLLLMIAIMGRLSPSLTLIVLLALPAMALSIRYFGRAMRERGVLAQQADARVAALVHQIIAALPLVQSYTQESAEQAKFTHQTAQAQRSRLSQHAWELLYGLGIAVVFGIGTAGILWAGSRQVLSEQLTIGQLLVFLAYLAQLYEPLNQLSHVGATVSTASAGVQRVFELLDTPEEVRDRANARPILADAAEQHRTEPTRGEAAQHPISADLRQPVVTAPPTPHSLKGAIEFANVSFAYQAGQPVLRNLSFTVPAGESVAVIGPSGVGKTTLLSLLPRFFDPTAGAIYLDGVDLRELRLRELRRHVALVLQEPILLATTIAENIGYGKAGASREEIETAARAAHADDFVRKLPHGYETTVGEGAARLSVGEKQRLNLARAFLKDAPILLLDEPTTALDAESETLVTASLARLMRGRTTLLVAHRPSTIALANKVLVLDGGQLAEFGSPSELTKQGGYFARVIRGQTRPG